MKKVLFVALAAIGLSFLASSCVKEKGFEERVCEIVAAQLDFLNQKVATLEKIQTALNDSLKSIRGDVEKLSQQSKSLTDSISSMKDSLAAQKKWTTEQLDAIGVRLDAIEEEQKAFMEDVYERLGRLESRIQKIDVVPDYNDGSVILGEVDSVITFVVRPAYVSDSIVQATGKDVFTLVAVQTLTKAVALDTLVIKKVTSENGVVSVTVDLSELPSGYPDNTYSACLIARDDNSETTSGFFPLYYEQHTTDLSKRGTANCYIVSTAGTYRFKTVQGNSTTSVGTVKSAGVLWESYGTDIEPTVGDLIQSDLSCANGYITFTTGSKFPAKKGNAVIAAKDDKGDILWSWHIWLTDQPDKQSYNESVGTMMDRNLGATNATKGDVGALGLLYQWGRKDPFLGANGKESGTKAASTGSWPTPVAAADIIGEGPNNLAYSITHPTTFIYVSTIKSDWYCTNLSYQNPNLWMNTSGGAKTIYDPCPVGWRVPDGGSSGVWRTAFGKDNPSCAWDGENEGFDFGSGNDKLVSSGTCWYPAAGYLDYMGGSLSGVGSEGRYWSCTPFGTSAYIFQFKNSGDIFLSSGNNRAYGLTLRCLSEE